MSACLVTLFTIACPGSRDQRKHIKKSWAKTMWGLVRWGNRSLLALFSIPHFSLRIPPPYIPCDWGILTVYVNTNIDQFGFHLCLTNLDICLFNARFPTPKKACVGGQVVVGRLRYFKRCLQSPHFSLPSVFSLVPFFAAC